MRRSGPGTRLSPRSQPPRAPLAPCFHPSRNTPDQRQVGRTRPDVAGRRVIGGDGGGGTSNAKNTPQRTLGHRQRPRLSQPPTPISRPRPCKGPASPSRPASARSAGPDVAGRRGGGDWGGGTSNAEYTSQGTLGHRQSPRMTPSPSICRSYKAAVKLRCVSGGCKTGGEYGRPRGRGPGMHRIRGASGAVQARGPGFPPDLSPRARPSPPVFTLPKHTTSAVTASSSLQ